VIVECWAKSDVGMQRTVNEDRYYVAPDRQLVLVFDGMGGHQAGDVAAQLAMETTSAFFEAHSRSATNGDPSIIESYDPAFSFETNLLRQAVLEANRVVLQKSALYSELGGMGSTVAGMALHGHAVSMINVGDSRIYLVRNGAIEQISRDHTLAEDQVERGIMTREEARESQLRHILSAVIGVDARIRIHADELAVFPGDLLLLCTDGLTAVMTDEDILQEILKSKPGPDVLNRLIEEVNRRGGPDNTTLTLTVISEESEPEE
jgi:PPM family protein phosphatase